MRIGYFLYDETYSGVIDSQAIDVVRFYNEQTEHESVLIASLPFRSQRKTLNKLQNSHNGLTLSLVAVPQRLQPKLFKLEARRIARIIDSANLDIIICRNALACSLAIYAKPFLSQQTPPKICFDGRGALMAECQEYGVYPKHMRNLLASSERLAVLHADHRIAVTEELVQWWQKEYGYDSRKHSIIPTTISTQFEKFDPAASRVVWRKKFGFTSEDIVFAFAGGRADWQGLNFWLPYMNEWLDNMPNLKLLLLTPENPYVNRLVALYPARVTNTFVAHEDVLKSLSAADHGIMWREPSVTNKVASPTKLSEYIQSGLNIISNEGTAVSRILQCHHIGHCLTPIFNLDYKKLFTKINPAPLRLRLHKKDFYTNLIRDIDQNSDAA